MRFPLRLVVVALVVALSGCAGMRAGEGGSAAVLAHVPHETTPAGEQVVVIRDYVELDKVEDRDVRRRVQYVWNYSRGTTQRRVWDEAGVAYETTDLPEMTLNATDPEMAWAYDQVRADPYYAGKLVASDYFWGGFSVREAHGDCGTGTRCVHVFAMRDQGRERVLHAIFDLASGKVVDHDYDAALGGVGQPITGEVK